MTVNREQKFRDARFGMFIHWGPYSLRGVEASWPLVHGTIPWDEYEDLANDFNPTRYDPAEWAALAKRAGVRYAILTSKHHDGYALFDTRLDRYAAPHMAAGRDLIRPFVEAFRDAGILVGFYFSLCDWHHPDYPANSIVDDLRLLRPARGLTPGAPDSIAGDPGRWQRYVDFMHGQVRELCTNYGEIDLLWFDGQWEHTAEEWQSERLVAMIRELQPGCILNNRLEGHGQLEPGFGDYGTPEQFVPAEPLAWPWETSMTINETWAYNPRDRAYKSSRELIATLAEVASKGGNFLLNIGPNAQGQLPPELASRFEVIGEWMEANAESIFTNGHGLKPGAFYGPTTASEAAVYLHVLGRPGGDQLQVRGTDGRVIRDASILATGRKLEFDQHQGFLEQGALRIGLPESLLDPYDTDVKPTLDT
ncbi:MAG: alpha-L-fucosidase [Thermomicrobiales bacterium]